MPCSNSVKNVQIYAHFRTCANICARFMLAYTRERGDRGPITGLDFCLKCANFEYEYLDSIEMLRLKNQYVSQGRQS